MTKRLTAVAAVILLVAIALVGCGPKQAQPAPQQPGGTSGALTGSIITAGSTSVQPFSELLAEQFMQKNKGAKVTVQGGGSSQGITAVQNGTAQIGASSRELTDQEKAGLNQYIIARDGIAMIVNTTNKVSDLKMDQIRKIYSGQIKNWKDVGGSDAPIVVVTRDEASGTRGAFEELIMGKDAKIMKEAVVQTSTGAVVAAVQGNPNAIGYISFSGINESIKTVTIEGIAPTAENVKNGSYKVNRPFIYMTKGEPSGVTKAFIDYALSDEGQKIAASEHLLTIK